jgi:hypothetical protein
MAAAVMHSMQNAKCEMQKSDATLKTQPATFERLGAFHLAFCILHFALI